MSKNIPFVIFNFLTVKNACIKYYKCESHKLFSTVQVYLYKIEKNETYVR